MTTTKVSNVEFDTLGTTQKPPPLPPSSRNTAATTTTTHPARPLSSSTKKRSNSASSARPVLHQPCSSTLGKFHDAVNFSLLNETSLSTSSTSRNASATSGRGGTPTRQPLASHRSASTSSNTPRSDHPVLVAKQKYKYMTKQKSYVDESLFGGAPSAMTNRFGYEPDAYQFSRTHVTHQLMSNLAPLQIRTGPPASNRTIANDGDTTRTDTTRRNNINEDENNRPFSATYKISSKPPTPKPWRP